jgi:hypothetical protein
MRIKKQTKAAHMGCQPRASCYVCALAARGPWPTLSRRAVATDGLGPHPFLRSPDQVSPPTPSSSLTVRAASCALPLSMNPRAPAASASTCARWQQLNPLHNGQEQNLITCVPNSSSMRVGRRAHSARTRRAEVEAYKSRGHTVSQSQWLAHKGQHKRST